MPTTWHEPGTPTTNLLNEKKYSVTVIRLPEKKDDSDKQEISLNEKLKILKEQEDYSPLKPRYDVFTVSYVFFVFHHTSWIIGYFLIILHIACILHHSICPIFRHTTYTLYIVNSEFVLLCIRLYLTWIEEGYAFLLLIIVTFI